MQAQPLGFRGMAPAGMQAMPMSQGQQMMAGYLAGAPGMQGIPQQGTPDF